MSAEDGGTVVLVTVRSSLLLGLAPSSPSVAVGVIVVGNGLDRTRWCLG